MTCKNCYIPNREIPDMDIDKMIDATVTSLQELILELLAQNQQCAKILKYATIKQAFLDKFYLQTA